MRTSRFADICRPPQQTVILDDITTSSCGLDIACICRDDKFLTSLQSELATSCNRDDQASKPLPLPVSHYEPLTFDSLIARRMSLKRPSTSVIMGTAAEDPTLATFAAAKDLCLTAIPSLAESRGGELVATVTVLMIIATIAVILRLYARKVSGAKFGTDDYLIVVALVCSRQIYPFVLG